MLSDTDDIAKPSIDERANNTCKRGGVEGGVSSSSEDVGGESKYEVVSETSGGDREIVQNAFPAVNRGVKAWF